jgi:hypothetical protein
MKKLQLNADFVIELIKSMMGSEKVLAVCIKHLKYQYLQSEAQKKVVKYMFDSFTVTNLTATVGIIGQAYANDAEVLSLLTKVKQIKPIDNKDLLLKSLEVFIKKTRFQILYKKIADLYNAGQHDEAIEVMAKESAEIEGFTLKEAFYTRIFADYEQRQAARIAARENDEKQILLEKLSFGIEPIDDATMGGFNKGTSVLIMARSGGGKSTWLKWIGMRNAWMGKRVVHFQAEGTEKECYDLYDAAWTGVTVHNIEQGVVDKSQEGKINQARRDIIREGGEIIVYASETFESMSVEDAHEIMQDIEAIYGRIDLAIFDYLEVFEVAGKYSGDSSERRRREKLANKITNIGVKFKCGVVVATQANDIAPKVYNDPDFVLTRNHLSEFKGLIKPFSYFLTVNQTDDEYEEGIARIYADKFRKYKKNKTWSIYQAMPTGRFYDAKRSHAEFNYEKDKDSY